MAIRERLAAVSCAPYARQVFGAEHHRWKLAPPLSAEEIPFEVPEDYRDFLTKVGSSGAGPGAGLVDPREWDGKTRIRRSRALPLADLGCTMWAVLMLTGPDRGRIFVHDRAARRVIPEEDFTFATWYEAWLAGAERVAATKPPRFRPPRRRSERRVRVESPAAAALRERVHVAFSAGKSLRVEAGRFVFGVHNRFQASESLREAFEENRPLEDEVFRPILERLAPDVVVEVPGLLAAREIPAKTFHYHDYLGRPQTAGDPRLLGIALDPSLPRRAT